MSRIYRKELDPLLAGLYKTGIRWKTTLLTFCCKMMLTPFYFAPKEQIYLINSALSVATGFISRYEKRPGYLFSFVFIKLKL